MCRAVGACLDKLATIVTDRILPWAASRTEEDELEQIKLYGNDAWCEQRWIADYEQFLGIER